MRADVHALSNVCVVTNPKQALAFAFFRGSTRKAPGCGPFGDAPAWNASCGMPSAGMPLIPPSEAQQYLSSLGHCEPPRWVAEPTLFLVGFHANPGHQFYDVLWSLYSAHAASAVPYTHIVVAHDSAECSQWLCGGRVLEALHARHSPRVQMRGLPPGEVECYSQLYLPQFVKYRPGGLRAAHRTHTARTTNPSPAVNGALHLALTRELHRLEPPARSLLVYGHGEGKTRHWTNAQAVAAQLTARGARGVRYVHSLSALSFREQCRAFWDADTIVMAHGGQTAHTLCARPGTRVVEMACDFFGWLSSAGGYVRSMQLDYRACLPQGCPGQAVANSKFWSVARFSPIRC